ncbi:ABC transporter ATP-binding protein [Anaerolentibacter hominis]|uniref:ABC transporter ATP-binding protein n=1 Tax=Anaerolentibacter hominis TaxID=3079009 RepID=UPI0031B88E36
MNILLKEHKVLFGITLILNLFLSVLGVASALLLEHILNAAVTQDWGLFRNMILITPVYLSVTGILIVLGSMCTSKLIAKSTRTLRANLYRGIHMRDPEQYRSVNTAEYISALSNDVKIVEENICMPFLQCVEFAFVFVGTVILLLYYSPVIAGLMFLCLLVLYLVPALLGKSIRVRQERLSQSFAAFTIRLKDQLSGYDVIRSFRLSAQMEKSFGQGNEELANKKYDVDKVTSVSEGLAQTLAGGTQLLIMLVSAYMVIKGHMTAGVLLALLQLSGSFVQPLGIIMQNIAKIQGAKPVLQRILELSEYKPSVFSGTEAAVLKSEIQFEHVSFGYQQNQLVLHDMNVSFEKNKKYVIIGASGCGKSTLIHLLSAQYGGYTGHIYMDGRELRTLKLDDLLSQISVIHQNVYMFDETIKDNIDLHRDYSGAEWKRTLQISGVGNFLPQTAEGLNTPVGENGINLSGGQRQRVAVARALIEKKPVLILDEGTSAVDQQTAYEIETALLDTPDITLITITHNLNPELLCRYDQIIYMKDGQIAGIGGYEDLIKEQSFKEFLRL